LDSIGDFRADVPENAKEKRSLYLILAIMELEGLFEN
jgi:hypothetical protein